MPMKNRIQIGISGSRLKAPVMDLTAFGKIRQTVPTIRLLRPDWYS